MGRRSASVLFALAVCVAPLGAQERGNVLVVVADDVGIDRIAAYGAHPDAGPTPVIDALAARGLLFRNAYANPSCSPTRMAMLTGRYGFRTGVGDAYAWVNNPNGFVPGLREEFVAEPLKTAGYQTGLIGKWHLATLGWSPDPFMHPILAGGFDIHLGSMAQVSTPEGYDYFHWLKNEATPAGASQSEVDRYATSENVDDALQLVERWGDRPWMLWLAFNAAHAPYHAPPAGLHTLPVSADSPDSLLFRADLEALDTELGRLLAGIPARVLARTTIVVVGDNGTPEGVMTPPKIPGHYKSTVYEGGIRVPLIIAGHRVAAPGREVRALVHAVDLFATLIELTAARDPGTGVDSVSLLPYLDDPLAVAQRRWVYSEHFEPNGPGPYFLNHRAVRNERYKLVSKKNGLGHFKEFYDLQSDPAEHDNLLSALSPEQQDAYLELQGILAGLH